MSVSVQVWPPLLKTTLKNYHWSLISECCQTYIRASLLLAALDERSWAHLEGNEDRDKIMVRYDLEKGLRHARELKAKTTTA